jgi:hypothetical protein
VSLSGRFQGFEFLPIVMWQNPKLKQPQQLTKRTKPRVWLPYEALPLWDMWVTAWCHLDLERSGVALEKECSTCGKKIYERPLFEKRHLVVDSESWDRSEIFHIYEYPRWIFCTERVKAYIEQANFTNVSFMEDGEIPTNL